VCKFRPNTNQTHSSAPRTTPPAQLKNVLSQVKRSYGWNRTELTGITGARTWCGHGVFAPNLVKISALAA
jgi:hypothetical protein